MVVQNYIEYRQAVQAEDMRRVAEHKAAILATAGTNPLNFLADGDSWFDYPLTNGVPGEHSDIIAQLRREMPLALILNLAHAGDATTDIMGVAKYVKLRDLMLDSSNGKFDAILFSGGGNDLVGNQFRFWLHDANTVDGDIGKAVNTQVLADILGVVETGYRDLATLRNLGGDPGVPIITHGYDFAIPDGRGVCLLGPWLWPSLQSRGWMKNKDDPADQQTGAAIVRQILGQFDLLLRRLEADPRMNLIYVRTQGTLPGGTAPWDNELHPRPPGFSALAEKFAAVIKERFPGRPGVV